MAIYHLSVKAVSRSAGRSATAAAAYRAGVEITDERTGEIHDYRRKRGVESADLVLPPGAPEWATDRAALWNAAEAAERRKDACVAREYVVALPSELPPEARQRLALDFAREMAEREGCAVDVAIHAPGKDGDDRNHHAHILRTTRKVGPNGLTAKLDTEQAGRRRADDLAAVRARWAELVNDRLQAHGIEARVDHRTLAAQGIERPATTHLGPAVTAMQRRKMRPHVERLVDTEIADRLIAAVALGKEARAIGQALIDTETELQAAIAERERMREATAARAQLNRFRAAEAAPSYEERRRALVGDVVPDPRKRLAAMRAAIEADLMRNAPKVLSEDERRAGDAKAVRAKLSGKPYNKAQVNDAKPGMPHTGTILLVTDFHVAQDAGRDWATLHDKRQLRQSYQVGDKPRILYGPDGKEREQTPGLARRGPRI